MQLVTQEDDHDNDQEEHNHEHKWMIKTTMMARRSATKNTRRGLGQWPRKGNREHKNKTTMMAKKRQPIMQEEDHGHGNGQKEHN
jgi:hypothetical protein